jgi:hypothetical protein
MPEAGKSPRLGARLPQEKARPRFGPRADEVAFPRLTEAEIAEAVTLVHNFLGRAPGQHSIDDRSA